MPLWSKRHGLPEAYPLACHLLDTAASATALWDHWLRPGLRSLIEASLGPDARSWVAAAAGLHDIGKANPVFAGQLAARPGESWLPGLRDELTAAGYPLDVPRERINGLRRHEKVSAMHLADGELEAGDPIGTDWLAAAALGHHGAFELPTEIDSFRLSAGGPWKAARNALRAEVLGACGLDPEAEPPSASPAVAVLIAGLVVLADRTASEKAGVLEAMKDLRAGAIDPADGQSWVQARARYFSERLEQTIGVYTDFNDARASIAGDYTLRPLQEAALQAGNGLWIAMAPTGNGKTEAALLRHSLKTERLIFALPTQATTNAMMKRVQKAYQGTGNVAELAHRLASVEDFYARSAEHETLSCSATCTDHDHKGENDTGLIPSDFLRNGTARLLAPVSVSTIDQVLAGSLRTRWAHLRLLTLANAHVVIDEAHLMDQYQSALGVQLMRWWGATGTRVTLLSATLPRWQRDAFARAYDPSWAAQDITFPSEEQIPGAPTKLAQQVYGIAVTTTEAGDTVQAHIDWAVARKAAAPAARLGIVVNTVGRAQETARRLQAAGMDPIVLHSRMTAGHRRDAADRLLTEIGKGGPGTGTIVVGTQAIEASLDIDLDAMSTDLAPSPSIIQRAGRVWRHTDPRRPGRLPGEPELPLHIVRGEGKFGALPYFASELDRVWKYLQGQTRLAMPDDSQDFVEASSLGLDDVDWKEQDELTEHARRSAKAGSVVINGSEITAAYAELDTLQRLTGFTLPDDEAATRLIEQPSITIIAIDPGGKLHAPGAWKGSVTDLEALAAADRPGLRLAMEATVPLNGKLARMVLDNPLPWNPEARILQGMYPVILGKNGLSYDTLLGLVFLERAT